MIAKPPRKILQPKRSSERLVHPTPQLDYDTSEVTQADDDIYMMVSIVCRDMEDVDLRFIITGNAKNGVKYCTPGFIVNIKEIGRRCSSITITIAL